jgi:IS30 family transposase
MLQENYKQSAMAKAIGKDTSVIYREIKPNGSHRSGAYRCDLAIKKYHNPHKVKPKYITFIREINPEVDKLIRLDYSTKQAGGGMRNTGLTSVGATCMYQHIWNNKKTGENLHSHLRNKGRRPRKRGALNDTRGI